MSRNRANLRKAINEAAKKYTNELVLVSEDEFPRGVKIPKGMTRLYRNNNFIAMVYDGSGDDFFSSKSTKVMVRHNTGRPVIQWKHLQEIKNQIFGEEALAVQFLPPQSKLSDEANLYWFFVYSKEDREKLNIKENHDG